MNKLSLLTLIIPQERELSWQEFLQTAQLNVLFSFPCAGAADSSLLSALGLSAADKTLFFGVTPTRRVHRLMTRFMTDMGINLPQSGVAISIPVTSISGKTSLEALLGGQKFDVNEVNKMPESSPYALLVAICEGGSTDNVMDAARAAGARGGTVVHAKGTAGELAKKFMGMSLANEKEVILIICREEDRRTIMQGIMDKAGIDTPAHTILFTLPVEETAGLRSLMRTENEEEPEGETAGTPDAGAAPEA